MYNKYLYIKRVQYNYNKYLDIKCVYCNAKKDFPAKHVA